MGSPDMLFYICYSTFRHKQAPLTQRACLYRENTGHSMTLTGRIIVHRPTGLQSMKHSHGRNRRTWSTSFMYSRYCSRVSTNSQWWNDTAAAASFDVITGHGNQLLWVI